MLSQENILTELNKGNDAWVPIEGIHALVSVATNTGVVEGLLAQPAIVSQQLNGARLDASKGMIVKAFYNTRTAEIKIFLAASLSDPVSRRFSRRPLE